MVKFCTSCGNKLDDDAVFCTNCGSRNDGQKDSDAVGKFIKENPLTGKVNDIYNKRKERIKKVENKFSKSKDKVNDKLKVQKRGNERAKIPHFGGITEITNDSIIIKKTNEVIPIKDIRNFSIHQSSQTLWSDVKVDFDYNGLHYRTQVIGTMKGQLQNVERKVQAIELNEFSMESNVSKPEEKSKVQELKELKELLDSGVIDEDEFKELKAEVINKF